MRTRNIEFVISCRFAISDRGRSAALARETGPERLHFAVGSKLLDRIDVVLDQERNQVLPLSE